MTAPNCPDPPHCPVPSPTDVDLRLLRTVAIPAGRAFYTTYRSAYWPEVFNPGFGDTRFAPLEDNSGSPVPTLYGGSTRTVSLLETVFHEVHTIGVRAISTALDLAGRGLVQLHSPQLFRFIDLSDSGLSHLGLVRADGSAARECLVSCSAEHYPCTRQWATRLHTRGHVGGHLPVGLLWDSRVAELAAADDVLLGDLLVDATSSVFVLFGDRVPTDVNEYASGQHYDDLAADGAAGLVMSVAGRLGAVIL